MQWRERRWRWRLRLRGFWNSSEQLGNPLGRPHYTYISCVKHLYVEFTLVSPFYRSYFFLCRNSETSNPLTHVSHSHLSPSFRLCCISPVLAARLFPGVAVTVGDDTDPAACAVRGVGASHVPRPVTVS